MFDFGKEKSNSFIAGLLIFLMALPYRTWIPLGPFNSISTIDILIFVLLVKQCLHLFYHKEIYVVSRSIFVALLSPVIVSIISFTWTIDPYLSIKSSVIGIEALAAYLVTLNICRKLSFDQISKLISLFIFLLIIVSTLSYFEVPGFLPQIPPTLSSDASEAYMKTYKARFSHPFIGLSNNLASVLAFFPFIIGACYTISGSKYMLWALYLNIAAIGITLSRGAILAIGVLFLGNLLSLKSRWTKIRNWFPSILIILSISLPFILVNPAALKHLSDRFTMTEIYTRLDLYQKTINTILEAPLLGFGAGVSLDTLTNSTLQSVHNSYLEQVLYFGVIGGIPVSLCLIFLPLLIKRIPALTRSSKKIRNAVALAAATELLIFMSHPSFEASLLRIMFYFSIGLGVSLIIASNRLPEV